MSIYVACRLLIVVQITAWGSNLRGQFKSAAKSFVASAYGFQVGDAAATKEKNQNLVTVLKYKSAFTCHVSIDIQTILYGELIHI